MTDDDALKRFPSEKLSPTTVYFEGLLTFNPYVDIPPVIWHAVTIHLAPIDLGGDARYPDVCGTTVDTTMRLGGIILPHRRWQDFGGTLGPVEDQGASSIYVSNAHNPIDILEVTFTRKQGLVFQIDLDINIEFEFEGAGFSDTRCSLSVEAPYSGIRFRVPEWTNPDEVEFPEEWGIPDEFNVGTVHDLFGRFIDTTCFELSSEGSEFTLAPVEGPPN